MKQALLWVCALAVIASAAVPGGVSASSWGMWVECEGDNATLSSRRKIVEMLDAAARYHYDTVFVQVYRHDRAWFKTDRCDSRPYQVFAAKEKTDLLRFVIDEAHKRGIAVHAWMNMLRIGKDKNAHIVKTLGPDVVTRDNKGRSMLSYPGLQLPGEENRYYEADGSGYWLEPGDPRVRSYLLAVVEDVLTQYPDIDGIHLDFIRMPYTVPFSPGSRFPKGITYGYGKASVERFVKQHGADPLKPMAANDTMQQWDGWRRDQITELVRDVRKTIDRRGVPAKLSTAVVCWADRAYLSAFQDWRRWLEERTVDFICLMNYSYDDRLARYITATGMAFRGDRQIYIGLGAYMLADRRPVLYRQIDDCVKLKADGIALFSYDTMAKDKTLFEGVSECRDRAPAAAPAR
ncbi:MAG TPA: family 10 glycosylhydrolase [bacterium]|nr:family 10 glycosylhydrolase [bacterium]